MGCTHNKQQKTPLVPCRTVNGILKVTIEQANIYKRSKISSMDPYLRMTMSNQQFRGYIHKKADRKNLFNESFQFVINSCFKPEGRSLTIEMWNKSLINHKMIGMGIIDLDPFIKLEENTMMGSRLITVTKENQSYLQRSQLGMNDQLMRKSFCKMKVFLNHGVEQVGYLNTAFEFIEQPITTIGLKFVYASLRRTSSIFTTMHCSVQAIAGQEILRTHKRKDEDTKNPPSWQDETLMFNIPVSLKDCVIRVLDDEKEVGHVRFNLGQIINKKGEHYFTQQLEHEQAISGVIKFCVMVGIQSVVVGSKRGSRVEQTIVKTEPNEQDQVRTENQVEQHHMYTQMKRELPSQKSTRLQESEFRTFQYTHPTQEEPARQPFKELMKPNQMSPIRRLDNSISQDKSMGREAPVKVHRVEQSAIVLNGQELKA